MPKIYKVEDSFYVRKGARPWSEIRYDKTLNRFKVGDKSSTWSN